MNKNVQLLNLYSGSQPAKLMSKLTGNSSPIGYSVSGVIPYNAYNIGITPANVATLPLYSLGYVSPSSVSWSYITIPKPVYLKSVSYASRQADGVYRFSELQSVHGSKDNGATWEPIVVNYPETDNINITQEFRFATIIKKIVNAKKKYSKFKIGVNGWLTDTPVSIAGIDFYVSDTL